MSGTSNTNISSNSNIGTGVIPTAALPPTSTATITMQTATPVSVPTIIAVPQAQPQTVAAAPAPPNADAVKLSLWNNVTKLTAIPHYTLAASKGAQPIPVYRRQTQNEKHTKDFWVKFTWPDAACVGCEIHVHYREAKPNPKVDVVNLKRDYPKPAISVELNTTDRATLKKGGCIDPPPPQ